MAHARSLATPGDIAQMLALAARYPRHTASVMDLPYRLASAALHGTPIPNACRWLDGGELVGWCAWQPAWSELDYAVHPDHSASLGPEILAWATVRVEAAARLDRDLTAWWVGCRPDDATRTRHLEAAGFVREPWKKARFESSLVDHVPTPTVPAGFTIRPIQGESEVEAYVTAHRAAFGSARMTVQWRRRTLAMPGHSPDLDLVAEAPGGAVAGFAVLWLGRIGLGGDLEAQVEPVGVRPEFRGLGLARALLLEGMRRARAAGARRANVEAYSFDEAACALYEPLMPERGQETWYYKRAP